MNYKYARWFFVLLTLLFIAKIYLDEKSWKSIKDFPQLTEESYPLLVIIIILIPLNWFLEGLKWRIFLPKDKKPGYFFTLKIIFAGVSLAILTPNRMGDFIGRGLVSPIEMRQETVLATFMGNFCQFFVLIMAGIPALFFLFPLLASNGGNPLEIPVWVVFIWFLFCLTFLFTYTKIVAFSGQLFSKWQRTAVWAEKLETLSKTSNSALFSGLFLALIRYVVFSSQYYLVLHLFGIQLHFFQFYTGLASLYLFQTIIPLPPFYSLIARGEASVLIWGIWDIPPIAAVTASYILFVFNLIVPAIAGLCILIPIKKVKTKS